MERFKNRDANFADPKQVNLRLSSFLGGQGDTLLIAGSRKDPRHLVDVREGAGRDRRWSLIRDDERFFATLAYPSQMLALYSSSRFFDWRQFVDSKP
jgi:hypothetical protein